MIAGLQYKLIHTESFNFCVSLEVTVVRINSNEVSKRHSTGIRICISKTILIYESVCAIIMAVRQRCVIIPDRVL